VAVRLSRGGGRDTGRKRGEKGSFRARKGDKVLPLADDRKTTSVVVRRKKGGASLYRKRARPFLGYKLGGKKGGKGKRNCSMREGGKVRALFKKVVGPVTGGKI